MKKESARPKKMKMEETDLEDAELREQEKLTYEMWVLVKDFWNEALASLRWRGLAVSSRKVGRTWPWRCSERRSARCRFVLNAFFGEFRQCRQVNIANWRWWPFTRSAGSILSEANFFFNIHTLCYMLSQDLCLIIRLWFAFYIIKSPCLVKKIVCGENANSLGISEKSNEELNTSHLTIRPASVSWPNPKQSLINKVKQISCERRFQDV